MNESSCRTDPSETIEFNGTTYRLMGTRKYYLSQSTTNSGRRGAQSLHVAIWEHFSGQKVPPGWHVHHKDGNTFNNDFDNLECLPAEVHRKFPKLWVDRDRQSEHLSEIRPLAAEWHHSEEGRRWHSDNARRSWEKKTPRTFTCHMCGKDFESKNHTATYCSPGCQQKFWRESKDRPTVRVTCVMCGTLFETKAMQHKDQHRKTCGRKCQSAAMLQKRNGIPTSSAS